MTDKSREHGIAEVTIKGDVRRLHLKPGDILVVDLPNRTDLDVVESVIQKFSDLLKRAGHDNEVIGITDALQLSVVTP